MLAFIAVFFPLALLGGGLALERFERQLGPRNAATERGLSKRG
jgi:hypothetical protein